MTVSPPPPCRSALRRRGVVAGASVAAVVGMWLAAAPSALAKAAAPSMTHVASTSGPTAGHGRVTITGTGFSHVTAVHFGRAKATAVKVSSSRRLTVTVPAHAAGTVDVRVTARAGTSKVRAGDRYRYYPTSCTSIPGSTSGSTVWTGYYSTSGLATGIRRLVCSAATNSTIRIKSWFIVPDGPSVTGLLSDLKIMHTFHHVTIQVLVGRNGYAPSVGGQGGSAGYASLKKALSGWASLDACARACSAGAGANSLTHSKYVLVSNMAGPRGVATLSTSANLTTQQLTLTAESGIVNYGNTPLYTAFLHDWNHELSCARGSTCAAVPAGATAVRAGSMSVWFSPNHGVSPYDVALMRYQGAKGCVIQGMSLRASDKTMFEQLTRLRSEGCTVRLEIEHKPSAGWLTSFQVKGGTDHDKMLTIYIPGKVRLVMAGSLNFQPGSNLNNQQTIETSASNVFSEYSAWFTKLWKSSHERIWT